MVHDWEKPFCDLPIKICFNVPSFLLLTVESLPLFLFTFLLPALALTSVEREKLIMCTRQLNHVRAMLNVFWIAFFDQNKHQDDK